MKRYVVIRDFAEIKLKEQFIFKIFYGKDVDNIDDKMQVECMNSDRQAWIMTKREMEALKEVLK